MIPLLPHINLGDERLQSFWWASVEASRLSSAFELVFPLGRSSPSLGSTTVGGPPPFFCAAYCSLNVGHSQIIIASCRHRSWGLVQFHPRFANQLILFLCVSSSPDAFPPPWYILLVRKLVCILGVSTHPCCVLFFEAAIFFADRGRRHPRIFIDNFPTVASTTSCVSKSSLQQR